MTDLSQEEWIVRRMLEWLPAQTPEVWHAIALGWNFVYDLAPVEWIARQKECDAGTAQFIFWQMQKSDLFVEFNPIVNEPADLRREYDFAVDILTKWRAGFYSTRRFDVGEHIMTGLCDHIAHLEPAAEIPQDIKKSFGSAPSRVEIPIDMGIPRHIILAYYEETGEPLPALYRPLVEEPKPPSLLGRLFKK